MPPVSTAMPTNTPFVPDANLNVSNPGAFANSQLQAYLGGQQANAQNYATRMGLQGQQYVADQNRASNQYSADQNAATNRYNTDASTNQFNQRLRFAQDRYNQLFPMIAGQLGSGVSARGGPSGQAAAGLVPSATSDSVYSPQQIQEQVNATQAQNQRAGATAFRTARRDLGGRGQGNNSPLLAAIQSNLAIGTQAANSQAAQSIPFQAAQANATQALSAQRANMDAYSQRQQEGIQRSQVDSSNKLGLLGILAQLLNINV